MACIWEKGEKIKFKEREECIREKNENSKIDNESQACGPTHLMKERKRIAAKGSRPYIEGVNEGNPNKQTNMYLIFNR
jgi:hypothetical protein